MGRSVGMVLMEPLDSRVRAGTAEAAAKMRHGRCQLAEVVTEVVGKWAGRVEMVEMELKGFQVQMAVT